MKLSDKRIVLSVIVPTYNSAALLRDLFKSLAESESQNFETIINDDLRSGDDAKALVKEFGKDGLKITYLKQNKSMAQGRKRAAKEARGDILLHLDSDMQVTAGLIGECIEKIEFGYNALVVPEESFGTTFWAKCKWLEKKCYEGVENIESLRCVSRQAYDAVGGHNEDMVMSEDKDLDIRVRGAGFHVGRTQNFLLHNEGELRLVESLRKKRIYSGTASIFANAHPHAFRWQANILNRYAIYLKNGKYLFRYPAVYAGLFFMKTCELAYGGFGFLAKGFSRRSRRST